MASEHQVNADYPEPSGGFSFDNARRNAALEAAARRANTPHGVEIDLNNAESAPPALGSLGFNPHSLKAHKTGTTIVGVVYEGGVVLGADTRATSELVVDKNCEKIHYMAPNMYCCGAGTAADTEAVTGSISSKLELLRLETARESRLCTAVTMLKQHLFRYQGHVSAALVLGGVDHEGAHLYTIYPHGSTDKLPFVTMGSGSLAAMAVFEANYKEGLTEAEAVRLVADAIRAGIFNDLGSGSNVDVCVIRNNREIDMKRNFETPNEQGALRSEIRLPTTAFAFPPGTATVIKETVTTF